MFSPNHSWDCSLHLWGTISPADFVTNHAFWGRFLLWLFQRWQLWTNLVFFYSCHSLFLQSDYLGSPTLRPYWGFVRQTGFLRCQKVSWWKIGKRKTFGPFLASLSQRWWAQPSRLLSTLLTEGRFQLSRPPVSSWRGISDGPSKLSLSLSMNLATLA